MFIDGESEHEAKSYYVQGMPKLNLYSKYIIMFNYYLWIYISFSFYSLIFIQEIYSR